MQIVTSQKPMIGMGMVSLPLTEYTFFLHALGTAASYYDSFKKSGTAYQVPAGFKLQALAETISTQDTATAGAYIAKATASAANQSGAPAGFAYIGAGTPMYFTPAAAGGKTVGECFYEWAAGEYPTLQSYGKASVMILCRLVPV